MPGTGTDSIVTCSSSDSHATGPQTCNITAYNPPAAGGKRCQDALVVESELVVADGKCQAHKGGQDYWQQYSFVPAGGNLTEGMLGPIQFHYSAPGCEGAPDFLQDQGGCKGSKFMPLEPPATGGSIQVSCKDASTAQICRYETDKCGPSGNCMSGPGLLPQPPGKCSSGDLDSNEFRCQF